MPVQIIFGGAAINFYPALSTTIQIKEALDLLLTLGVRDIDTAHLYPGSEVAIGEQASRTSFNISTKAACGYFGSPPPTKSVIISNAQESCNRLKVASFQTFYFHGPNTDVPWEEQLEGVNELYKKGIFQNFGISNFTAEQVEEIYNIAKAKGYVQPSIFQGKYNAVARRYETLLFPTLRRLGIAFHAYSPIAGGFLTKSIADLDAGAGRFNGQALGGMYNAMYNRPALREMLGEWHKVAEKEGISPAELAYRWVANASILSEEKGDAVIFGAGTLEQIEQTVGFIRKGGLSVEAKNRIDELWLTVKDEAPLDNATAI